MSARLSPRGQWTLKAACAKPGKNDDRMWFPERGANEALWVRRARRVCGTCTVRLDCLEDVLRRNGTLGVWAGTTSQERSRTVNLPVAERFAVLVELGSTQIARAFRTEA